MTNKTTYKLLKEKQSLPLLEKIEYAKKRIIEFYNETGGNCFVSFSGGFDSTVLLHIARSIYPDLKGVFSNTTNEDPEIIKFVKSVDNIEIIYPKMNFKECVSKYGFPMVSKKVSRSVSELRKPTKNNPNIRNLYLTGKNRKGQYVLSWKLAKKWYFLADKLSVKFEISSVCCDILKKKPMEEYIKSTKTYPIVGTIAEESQDRELNYIKYGCNIIGKNPKSRPISIFTKNDIYQYAKLYNLSYCSLYDHSFTKDGVFIPAETRTGCVACGMGCHLEKVSRFENLKKRHPKYYNQIMSYENNGVSYFTALNTVLNINPVFKTKEYQTLQFKERIKDLEDCVVLCNLE